MTFWEASDIADEYGYELWSDEFRKIRNMSKEEMRKYFSSPKEEKHVDPELDAFQKFSSLMRDAERENRDDFILCMGLCIGMFLMVLPICF